MTDRTRIHFLARPAFLAAVVLPACATAEDLSRAHFANPPVEARPAAYWPWLNGNADLQTITTDLEEAKAKGMSGLEIWDVAAHSDPNKIVPSGPAFLSEESLRAIRHALKEGKRLGLNIGMIASSGWNAGGTWVTLDWAQKELYSSSLEVKGPVRFDGPLPFPNVPRACPKKADGSPQFHREVAVLAVPKNDQKKIAGLSAVVNLTERLKDGRLSWPVPEGEWVILRFVCSNNGQRLIVPSPNSDGLHIDFLEPSATQRHLQHILDRLGITPMNAAEVGLDWLEFDSMELHEGIPWTDRFLEYFVKWCGYSPMPYLPILAGWKIEGATDAFLYDHRQALSEQLIFSHYAGGRDFLKRYGIQLVAEAGGPGPPIATSCSVDALKALGNVSVPRGEFWNRHRNMFLIKEISSAAHIYGLRFVDAEAFTTWRRWMDGPFEMKRLADRALCEGLNRFTYHTFAHSPPKEGLPGWAYHAGSDINPRITWWEQSRPFHDYLARCCYVLQQGHFVADVCAYYGDQAPNFWPLHHNVPNKPLYPGLDPGYDYDVVNSDVILNRMKARDGRIVLPDGMSYRLLVLPNQDHIPVEVLEKIADLVKAGAVVSGPKPARDPRLADQPRRTNRVRELADALWGVAPGHAAPGRAVGRGRVLSRMTTTQALATLGIAPDFGFAARDGAPAADFIHRRTPESDIYFVRNTCMNSGMVTCRFRVRDRQPELWDPATGRIGIAIPYRQEADGIELDLPLAPGGATFVVFRQTGPKSLRLRMAQPTAAADVPGPWTLRFPDGWGVPPEVRVEKLQSWTDFAEEDAKYFSGTAAYHCTLEIAPTLLADGGRVFLDLGEVREVAEVLLNDRALGVVWQPPFRVDLTSAARAGQNKLIVKITNLWINRLRGDMVTKGKRYTRTNQAVWTSSIGGDETWREQPSGLLGPVRLLQVRGDVRMPSSPATEKMTDLPVVTDGGAVPEGVSGPDLTREQPVKPSKDLPLPAEVFLVEGRTAFLILPTERNATNATPWVWYAPTLPGLPGAEEKWMFQKFIKAGIAVAGIDVGESYGSPDGRSLFSAFYDELVWKRRFSGKPCLLARSRGGLMLYNWAVEHPESVACIAGIYPVCDLASYPGINKACGAYGMTAQQLADALARHNPIQRVGPLAKAQVPIFHIHGDADAVVPLEKNSAELAQQYRQFGGKMTLTVIEGRGHDMWLGWFQCQELVDFVIAHAREE